jgi:hypothetical protein
MVNWSVPTPRSGGDEYGEAGGKSHFTPYNSRMLGSSYSILCDKYIPNPRLEPGVPPIRRLREVTC